ncbi:MAG: hypothetical protein HS122_01160 [Opitutaceae bacterium]|nr:hypothetical protein [Opitutaceae bacterium]
MIFSAAMLDALSAYPRWFVVPCLILAGIGILWILSKVLKWSLWTLAIVAVIGLVALMAAALIG